MASVPHSRSPGWVLAERGRDAIRYALLSVSVHRDAMSYFSYNSDRIF